jgi:transcriptional regulator with XRE-family HTH domain
VSDATSREGGSAQQLLQELRGRGLSVSEIAGELQRSPRMIRKVLNGETSGAVYRASLLELARTGQTTTVPPRRRSRSGDLVRVRSKAGAAEPTVVPQDTGGRYTPNRQGGRLRTTTYLGGGGRQHELQIPKGKTAKGREQANSEILHRVRSAARGQARDTQQMIKARITYANGRVMEVKEYNASTMLKRINDHGGGALGWFRDENGERYTNLDVADQPITGVTMTVYGKAKTQEYDRQRTRGRPRRTQSGWRPNY